METLKQRKSKSRSQVLDAFLTEIKAIQLSRTTDKSSNKEFDVYVSNGKPLIIQTFWDTNFKTLIGWDIFIPSSRSFSVRDTFDAVKKYLM